MAGNNASQNLSGMFYQMNQGLADEGKAGMQFVDTLRRSFAPEVDPNSSKSLMNYANYASRNGYKDEFNQYSRMSVMQGQEEQRQAEKSALAEGQLLVANSLSEARQIAVNSSLPSGERQAKVQELAQQAREQAAAAGLDPRTVNTPIDQLMNHITTTETQGQATSIMTEAADLQRQIAYAVAQNKPEEARALIEQYAPIMQRAEAHGSPELIGKVTNGLTALIKELPDAQERADSTQALRAVELTETGGSEAEIRSLLDSPESRAEYLQILSEREADSLAVQAAEQQIEAQRLGIEEDRAAAEKRAFEGRELGFERGGDLQYLIGTPMESQYKQQYAAAQTASGRKDVNNRYLTLNQEMQDKRREGLQSEALLYVNRIPQMLGDTETSDYNPFNKSLSGYANHQRIGTPEQGQQWTQHANVIAELLYKDPRFIGGNEKEKLEAAKEYTVNHLNRVDKYFKQAYINNEEAIKSKNLKDGVKRDEERGDWETVKSGKNEQSTSPALNPDYVMQKYEEFARRALENGNSITYEQWMEDVWKKQFHRPTRNPKLYRKAPGIPAFKGIQENMDNYVEAKADRMDPSLANRDQSWLLTDIAARQRANLSPPIGPMGEPEDYETKLRKARRNLPMAYPELDLGESADPYIYPSYTGNRGKR
jgi:hypothetical protein